MHLDNIRMVNFLERQNFSLHSFSLHAVVKLRFLVNFDSELLHADLVEANVNDSISSLPNGLPDLVVFQAARRGRMATRVVALVVLALS